MIDIIDLCGRNFSDNLKSVKMKKLLLFICLVVFISCNNKNKNAKSPKLEDKKVESIEPVFELKDKVDTTLVLLCDMLKKNGIVMNDTLSGYHTVSGKFAKTIILSAWFDIYENAAKLDHYSEGIKIKLSLVSKTISVRDTAYVYEIGSGGEPDGNPRKLIVKNNSVLAEIESVFHRNLVYHFEMNAKTMAKWISELLSQNSNFEPESEMVFNYSYQSLYGKKCNLVRISN